MKYRLFPGFLAVAALAMAAAAGAAAPEPKLKIGDPAPPIHPMAWIQGEPVTAYKPGHVYVVEFWATWCGPCNAMMPHLSELQKAHAGKLTVIGINSREAENGKAEVAAVTAFVKKKGDKMAYTVAMDEPTKSPLFESWMIAGGSYGIPTSFVVDGKGTLVWMGHPLGPNEEAFKTAVEQALAGKSDLAAARAIQKQTYEQNYARQQEKKLYAPVREAMARKDYAAAVAEADKIMAQSPENALRVFDMRVTALLRMDEKKGLETLRAESQDAERVKKLKMTGPDQYMANVAYSVANEKNLSPAMYDFALTAIQNEAAKNSSDFYSWLMVAELSDRLGRRQQAVEAQQKAITIASAVKGLPKDELDELQQKLTEYQSKS